MESHEHLKRYYLDAIARWRIREEQAMDQKLAEDRNDEAVFHRIALNVLDIFEKMFLVSYGAVYLKRENPKLQPILEQHEARKEQLRAACQLYFDTLPEPWKAKAAQDEEQGHTEEWKKELVKIEVARMLESIFHGMYQEVMEGHSHDGHSH